MQIVRQGIDLVDCGQIERLLQRHGNRFVERIFTAAEQAYANSNRQRVEKLAGRFAAKEAVLKLIGTGWQGKVGWRDIEVTNNALGEPIVTLSGQAREIAGQMGIERITVSITHTANFAIASAAALARR
jgi:holo-[acyl-carrier protein] synthase